MAITWDFFKTKVQGAMPHGQYLSGRATVIGAGPPNLAAFAGGVGGGAGDENELIFLIGMLQQMSVSQALNVQRLFEIGSVRQYFITGHAITTMQLSRIMYHGPNLLRALYAYYKNTGGAGEIKALLKRFQSGNTIGVNNHTVKIRPGEQNFFINMTSDLFSQPVGLLLMLRDQDELTYAMCYAENCMVDSYVFATDSNTILMSETTTVQAERIIPIGTGIIQLVQLIDETLGRPSEDAGDLGIKLAARNGAPA